MNDAELSQASSEYWGNFHHETLGLEDEAIANGVCGIGTEDDDDRPPTFEDDPSFYEHVCDDECDPGNCERQHALEFGYDH